MTTDAAFSGSVPTYYHAHLGPMYFTPYARDLVRRIPKTQGAHVLAIRILVAKRQAGQQRALDLARFQQMKQSAP